MEHSFLIPPLRVGRPEEIAWDGDIDVIVVGFGGAGACAAIEAAEQGAEVLVLDRYDGGGATARSGGVVYAGGTRFQAEAGVQDTAEEMHKYLAYQLALEGDQCLRSYCDGSAEEIEWLCRHGVEFGSSVYEAKADYPPDGLLSLLFRQRAPRQFPRRR
jgi:3-oxo-5alpha-steroid 4-dehydrogenase